MTTTANNNNNNEDTTMTPAAKGIEAAKAEAVANNNNIPTEKDAVQIDQIESAIHDAIFEHCEAMEIPEDARTALIAAAIGNVYANDTYIFDNDN